MLIHKTEYVENAHAVGMKAYFVGRDEVEFNMDLDNILISEKEESDRRLFSDRYNVKFNTGHMYCNTRDYMEYIENKQLSDLFYNQDKYRSGPDYDVTHLFEIRLIYPTVDQLQLYYNLYRLEDVDFLIPIFEGLLNTVVKRCGPGYREAFLKGATELAYALSHRMAQRQNLAA